MDSLLIRIITSRRRDELWIFTATWFDTFLAGKVTVDRWWLSVCVCLAEADILFNKNKNVLFVAFKSMCVYSFWIFIRLCIYW